MAPVNVHIPFYATVFRGDKLEAALAEIAPFSLRYGATRYDVYRYDDDRYKFLAVFQFEDKFGWERFWDSPEMTDWRVINQSYYQVPVIYGTTDVVVQGEMRPETVVAESPVTQPLKGDLAG